MATKRSGSAKPVNGKRASREMDLHDLPRPTVIGMLSAQIKRQADTIERLLEERAQFADRGSWSGPLLSPTPPIAGDPPRVPVTFELEAAVAGEVVSRVEDEMDEISLDLDELGRTIGNVPKDPGEEREAAQRAAGAETDRLAQRIAAALDLARRGKHKIAGAAAAAGDFDDVVDKIKEAEDSFKNTSIALRFERAHAAASTSLDKLDYRLIILRTAAERLAGDVDHLKDALCALD